MTQLTGFGYPSISLLRLASHTKKTDATKRILKRTKNLLKPEKLRMSFTIVFTASRDAPC